MGEELHENMRGDRGEALKKAHLSLLLLSSLLCALLPVVLMCQNDKN